MSYQTGVNFKRLVEWIAVTIGAFTCVLVSVAFAQLDQQMFPLPGLYLIEIALLGLIVMGYVVARPRSDTRWNAIPWVAAGIMLAFVILGGFSIGLFLVPALIAFAVTGFVVDLQDEGFMVGHLGLLLLAAVAQGAMMAILVLFA